MRKIFFGLLLAGAAAPALAAGGPGFHIRQHDDPPAREQSQQESRAERPARNDGEARPQNQRPADVQRPQFSGGWARPDRNDRNDRPQFSGGGGDPRPDRSVQTEGGRFNGGAFVRPDRGGEVAHPRPVMRDNPYAQSDDGARHWRRGQQGGGLQVEQVRSERFDRDQQRRFSGSGIRIRQPVVSDVPRPGTQPRWRDDGRRHDRVQWSGSWRNDRRYDWRDRRRHHGSLFHIGIYYDPFGWNYQPYSIGWRMWPNYYRQNYWIDPAMYGLPYPPPGTQWVRYWDDALLVDVYTGEVVDVINNFFW